MSEDLKEKIKYDLVQHPLDRDPAVLALAADRIEQLEARIKELEAEIIDSHYS